MANALLIAMILGMSLRLPDTLFAAPSNSLTFSLHMSVPAVNFNNLSDVLMFVDRGKLIESPVFFEDVQVRRLARETYIKGKVTLEGMYDSKNLYLVMDLNQNQLVDATEPKLTADAIDASSGMKLSTSDRKAFFHLKTNCFCLGVSGCFKTYTYRISLFDYQTTKIMTRPEDKTITVGPDCGLTFIMGEEEALSKEVLNLPPDRLGIKIQNLQGITEFKRFVPPFGGQGGLKGPKGDPGPPGLPGPKGDKGDKGDRGLRGESGGEGPQGPQGDQGPAGPRGMQGPQGAKGDEGPQGLPGEKGERGDRGEKGDPGVQGPPGQRGFPGPKGDKGDKGDQGDKGDKGDKGDRGEQGDKGDKGDKGDPGNLNIQACSASPGAQEICRAGEALRLGSRYYLPAPMSDGRLINTQLIRITNLDIPLNVETAVGPVLPQNIQLLEGQATIRSRSGVIFSSGGSDFQLSFREGQFYVKISQLNYINQPLVVSYRYVEY